MAKKTIIEKAAEKVGYGLAMAEDLAGTVQSAMGSVAGALKKSPAVKAKKAKKKAASKPAGARLGKKSVLRKKSAKKSPGKSARKAAKRPAKSAKKAARSRR